MRHGYKFVIHAIEYVVQEGYTDAFIWSFKIHSYAYQTRLEEVAEE
jgi:hypothetical protein